MSTGSDDAAVRYQAYSRLQAAALAMGETLPIPEIVVSLVYEAHHTLIHCGLEQACCATVYNSSQQQL